MKYTITADNISITADERSYIEKRFLGFERFMADNAPHEIFVTVSKTTAHQREDTVRVEARCQIGAKDFFAIGEGAEVVSATDQAKEELMREVTTSKAKRQTLFHRGARKLKSLLKKGGFGGTK